VARMMPTPTIRFIVPPSVILRVTDCSPSPPVAMQHFGSEVRIFQHAGVWKEHVACDGDCLDRSRFERDYQGKLYRECRDCGTVTADRPPAIP
jgi:hypothetical protein